MKNKVYRPFVVSITLGSLIALTGCVPLGNAGGFVAIQSENPPPYDQPDYDRPVYRRPVDVDFGERQREIIQQYYARREHEREDRDRYRYEDDGGDWHGHGHGHGRDDGYDRGDDYRGDQGRRGLPPGLARREQLPPGLERQIRRRGTLPPGLRTRPLPRALEARLPPPPPNCVRVLVGTDIVLLNERTRAVLDIIRDVAQLSQ